KMPIVSSGSAMVPHRNAFVRTRVTYSRLTMSQILRMTVRHLFNEDVVQGRLDQLEGEIRTPLWTAALRISCASAPGRSFASTLAPKRLTLSTNAGWFRNSPSVGPEYSIRTV